MGLGESFIKNLLKLKLISIIRPDRMKSLIDQCFSKLFSIDLLDIKFDYSD